MESSYIYFFVYVIFCIPGIIILSKKNRGIGYYIICLLWPLIGFNIACCLSKNKDSEDEESIEEIYKEENQ